MTTSAPFLTLAQGPVQDFLYGSGGKAAGTPGSEIAASADWLFMAIFWISIFSFLLLMGLTLYFVFRYRARPGVPSQRTVSHNTPLELFWSIVPLVVMTWLFFEGFWTYMDMQTVKVGAEPISVNASMWRWKFTYPNGAFSPEKEVIAGTEQPIFVVPAGRPVNLTLTSSDVIHSFWVPAFRNKRDVFPNRYTTFNFQAKPLTEDDAWHDAIPEVDRAFHRLGYRYRDHYLFCAEFCGNQHSEMAAIIRVVEPEVYAQIVEGWGTPDLTTPEEKMKYLRDKHGCNACHTVDGTPNAGPTWLNMFGYEFQYADGTTKVVDENHIRTAILDPGADIRGGFEGTAMQSYQGLVSEEEMAMFIEVFQYLSDKGPKSMLDEGGAPEGGKPSDPAATPGNEEGAGNGGA
jgi:cytochrome c oxidase subunit II